MKQRGIGLIMALGLIAGSSQAEVPVGYSSVPDSVNFPLPESVIEKWVADENLSAMRAHGWELFHSLQEPVAVSGIKGVDQLPRWQTWFSVTQAFAPSSADVGGPAYLDLKSDIPKRLYRRDGAPMPRSNMHPPSTEWARLFGTQLPTYRLECRDPKSDKAASCPDGMLFANNGDIMIAGEYYNLPAMRHLREHRLYSQQALAGMLREGKRSIPDFPSDAIVIKSMHWPIAADSPTAMPVWDNDPSRPAYQYNGYETWKRVVAVDASGRPLAPGATTTVKSLHGVKVPGYKTPRTYTEAPVVPISQFIHLRVDKALWNALDVDDRQLINQAAKWAYGRDFKPGDYLALIAFHIDTKEIYDWSFQSYWWHDQPNVGPFSGDKPALPDGPWRNYLMVTAYDQIQPREYDGTPRVAYNPYIEGVIHPLPTNCQNCHARAAYPSNDKQLGYKGNIGQYDDNPSGREQVSPGDAIFDNVLRTDFLWTIADRAIVDPPAHK